MVDSDDRTSTVDASTFIAELERDLMRQVNGGIVLAQPALDYPPIPSPGFYWAKCSDDTPNDWTVVKVFEEPEGGRWVENTVGGGTGYVHEWGSKLEPPGAVTGDVDPAHLSDEAMRQLATQMIQGTVAWSAVQRPGVALANAVLALLARVGTPAEVKAAVADLMTTVLP